MGWLLVALVVAPAAGAEPGGPLRVMAASSLRELAGTIVDRWSRAEHVEVSTVFAASSTLAHQVQAGAPCDIYVTADPAWLAGLELQDRYDWLGNDLVVVVPVEDPDVDLKRLRSLALAGPEVPAGKYAAAALEQLGIALPARVVYGSNVRDVLAKVAVGGAEAAVVYATDAAIEPRVRVSQRLSSASHPPIVYAVGLLTARGRPLFEALRAPAAVRAARELGFTSLGAGR